MSNVSTLKFEEMLQGYRSINLLTLEVNNKEVEQYIVPGDFAAIMDQMNNNINGSTPSVCFSAMYRLDNGQQYKIFSFDLNTFARQEFVIRRVFIAQAKVVRFEELWRSSRYKRGEK